MKIKQFIKHMILGYRADNDSYLSTLKNHGAKIGNDVIIILYPQMRHSCLKLAAMSGLPVRILFFVMITVGV